MDPIIGGALISGGLGMLQQAGRAKKQHERQKELMGIQFKNQQELNKQGADLQFDMWNKTNYGAQLEHMEKAGLNPGLMYGMSGGGGTTTGSQGGGSAQGGQAHAPMDIGASVQMAKILAETKLLKAQAENVETESKLKTEQAVTEGGKMENIISKYGSEELKKQLLHWEEQTRYQTMEEIGSNASKLYAEGLKTLREKNLLDENFENLKDNLAKDLILKSVEIEQRQKNVQLTEEQTRQIQHKIWQDWVNTGMGAVGNLGGTIAKFLKEVTNFERVDKEGNVTGGQTTKKKKI